MTLQLRINKIQIFHKPTRHKLESVGTIKSLETIHKPRSLGTKFIILILFMIKKKKIPSWKSTLEKSQIIGGKQKLTVKG